jgi:hypothetical protein
VNRTFSSFLFILVPAFLIAGCGGGGSGSSTGGTGGTTASGGGGTGGATGGTTSMGGSTGGSTGGTTSMGGSTGGTGGGVMDACKNAADGAVISDPAKDVQGAVGKCGQDNLGQEPATLDCIKALGLSDACAGCFDGTVSCTIMNCLNECIADAGSQPCKDCRKTNCDPAFEVCSGLVVP